MSCKICREIYCTPFINSTELVHVHQLLFVLKSGVTRPDLHVLYGHLTYLNSHLIVCHLSAHSNTIQTADYCRRKLTG